MNIYAFAELVITFLLPEYVHLGYCFMGWSQNFIRRWISLDRFNWYDMGQAWGRKVVCRNRKQLHLLTSSGDLYFTIDTWSTILCIRGGKTNTSEMWRVNRPAMLWFGGGHIALAVFEAFSHFFTKKNSFMFALAGEKVRAWKFDCPLPKQAVVLLLGRLAIFLQRNWGENIKPSRSNWPKQTAPLYMSHEVTTDHHLDDTLVGQLTKQVGVKPHSRGWQMDWL